MKLFILLVTLFGLGLSFTSCKNDEIEDPVVVVPSGPRLRVSVQPTFGAQLLFLDSTYTTAEGYKIQFTDLKFYVQNVRNGATQLIDAGLFDYRSRGTLLFEAKGSAANFTSLQANLGIEAAINHNNPSEFANSSMLNISNSNDMHWGWNPGYIFVKIEGKADTIQDANLVFDHNIVFHVGLDVNLQTLDFTNVQWNAINQDVSEFQLQLDMATFLQGSTQSIDVKMEYSSHSSPGQELLTLKVIENFKEALTPF